MQAIVTGCAVTVLAILALSHPTDETDVLGRPVIRTAEAFLALEHLLGRQVCFRQGDQAE